PANATLNFVKACASSSAFPPRSLPPVRSPRQCIGPLSAMPRRLWVVIGPLSGWKSALPNGPRLNGFGLFNTTSSGLPRSQARLSKSPNTWQLAHDVSPLLEVAIASYRNGRPATTLGGSGL